MANDLAVFQQNTNLQLADAFKDLQDDSLGGALSAGVSGNYPMLSMRGGKWRVKFQGVEHPVIDSKTGDAIPSLEVVIVKANPFITKQYFEGAYEEGASDSPVCWSLDGKVPAAGVPSPQHTLCALCPQNKFGSKVTPAGVAVKACQDNRKLAVVPLEDIQNRQFGGPMLFRVPASALRDLASYGQTMQARGYPYFAVATRIGFDVTTSYPKPTFRAIRPLTEAEALQVRELMDSPVVETVLGGEAAASAGTAAPAQDPDFEVPPSHAAATPPPPPPAAPVAAPMSNGVSFGAPAPVAPGQPAQPAQPKPRGRKAGTAAAPPQPTQAAPAPVVAPPVAPAAVAPAAQPVPPAANSQLEIDIGSLLAELNSQA